MPAAVLPLFAMLVFCAPLLAVLPSATLPLTDVFVGLFLGIATLDIATDVLAAGCMVVAITLVDRLPSSTAAVGALDAL